MSRYRAPAPRSAPYITAEGYQVLEAELKAIWLRRAEVTKALAAAAAEGDRSENAEYIYRKKELREIDRRIGYLQKRLPSLKVIADLPTDQSRVFFAAWVIVENDEGEAMTYRIVGPDEINPAKGWISIDSPVARALMKKTVDDEVVVSTPEGDRGYTVIKVGYRPIVSSS